MFYSRVRKDKASVICFVRTYIEGLCVSMEMKQEKYELVITADGVVSSDERFTMDDLTLGDQYEPIESYFINGVNEVIKRNRMKREYKISNQTLPRLTFQIFEENINTLTTEQLKEFPVCQYFRGKEIIRGIYPTVEAFKEYRNSMEFVFYVKLDGSAFVIYGWNLFSTIIFVQECLKRFGEEGEQFVLVYRDKVKKEDAITEQEEELEEFIVEFNGYLNPYSEKLLESKNIIFRGAPGTGKSYLAKEIAADIISKGTTKDYTALTDEQKQQIEFVQFHPSYDYSDFVEGLRPKVNPDGTMGFELQDGVFTRFVEKALKNQQESQKTQPEIEVESKVQNVLEQYFSTIEMAVEELETLRGAKFMITAVDEKHIMISIPENKVSNTLKLSIGELSDMLESNQDFNQVKDVTTFFNKKNATQDYSYQLAIFKDIQSKNIVVSKEVKKKEQLKPFVFIIDEINRGEISKIFGELFFAIDPGYRGVAGEVSTQYANLHEDSSKKFYIPDNVYIIGTMNDIDRSVDSFDFAMRRRFRFLEIKADESLEMLANLGEELKEQAIFRMTNLNEAISSVDELNENYHIGASYFLKLKDLDFDALWSDYLQPLLQDYIRGMYDEASIMQSFEKAYTEVGAVVADD